MPALHSMIIAQREIGRSIRDLRFIGAFTACLILGLGSVAINVRSYAQKKHAYDQSAALYARTLSEGSGNVMAYHNAPKSIARRPVATQFIALAGEADPDPRAVVKNEYSSWFHGELRKNPLPALFFPIDLVFVLGLVMTLFAFALAYDAVSSDTQRDTFMLVLSGPVSKASVLVGTWLGAVISLAIPYVLCAAGTAAILNFFSHSAAISNNDIMATVAFFVIGGIYLCAVTSIAILVSVLFRSAGSSMVCLVLIWLIGFIALPYSSVSIAQTINDPPGTASFENRLLSIGYTPLNSIAETVRNNAAKRLHIDGGIADSMDNLLWMPDEGTFFLDPRTNQMSIVTFDAWTREVRAAMLDELWKVHTTLAASMGTACSERSRLESRVEDMAAWLRRFSPYGCFLNASINLANTGFRREVQLREMTQRYRVDCVALCRMLSVFSKPCPSDLFPKPMLSESSASARLAQSMPDIIGIALMGLLSFLIAYRVFMRREMA